MSIRITITSTKGGVGKTTLTANLGGILADLGQRVLLVDADPQPTLSSYYPLHARAEAGLTHLIVHADIDRVISRTSITRLDLILSEDSEGKLRDWIRDAGDGRVRLKHILSRLDKCYDFILIDTQGAVGPLQDAAVAAADLLLSPIPPEILSAREFVRGTVAMLDRLKPITFMDVPIGPLRGIIYRQDRTVDSRRIVQALRNEAYLPSKGAISVLDTVIPSTVVYREAASYQQPVHRFETTRAGSTPSACETMLSLVKELFPHLRHASMGIANEDVRESR